MNKKKELGVLTGYATLSFFLAHILIYAKQGKLLLAIISTALSWTGYLTAHYYDNGKIMDNITQQKNKKNVKKLEKEKIKKIEATTGITLFITGVSVLAYGIGTGRYLTPITGSFTAIAGYLLTHEGFEDVLL
jgi:hypothetical protein